MTAVQNEMNGFGQNISSLEIILSIIQNVEKSYQISYSAFDSNNVDEDEYEGNNDNDNTPNYKQEDNISWNTKYRLNKII